jgi:hypothetical protein
MGCDQICCDGKAHMAPTRRTLAEYIFLGPERTSTSPTS